MVKFDRNSIFQILSIGDIELKVRGSLTTGFYFEGTNYMNVLNTGKDHIDEINHSSVEKLTETIVTAIKELASLC